MSDVEYYVFQPDINEKGIELKYSSSESNEDSLLFQLGLDDPLNSTMAKLLGCNDTPFDSDEPIKFKKNERIKLEVANDAELGGAVLNLNGTPVVSKEIYEILAPFSIKGIQLVPLTITDSKGKPDKSYYAIHVYNEIEAMDRAESDYEEGMYGEFKIERLSLDLSREKLEDRLIFRLAENVFCILFHKSIVDKISEVAPANSYFIPVSEWRPLPIDDAAKQAELKDSEYGYEYSYFIPIPTNKTFIPDLMENFWVEDNGCKYPKKEEADANTISYLRFEDTKKVIKQAYLDADCYDLGGTLVYSKRIYEALKPHFPIKGLQLVPAEIKIAKEGESITDMYVANIYREYTCIGGEEIDINSCKKLELDIDALSKVPLSERLVFRARQEESYYKFNFYHKSIAQIIAAAKPNGFVFLPVDEWSSKSATILNYFDR